MVLEQIFLVLKRLGFCRFDFQLFFLFRIFFLTRRGLLYIFKIDWKSFNNITTGAFLNRSKNKTQSTCDFNHFYGSQNKTYSGKVTAQYHNIHNLLVTSS